MNFFEAVGIVMCASTVLTLAAGIIFAVINHLQDADRVAMKKKIADQEEQINLLKEELGAFDEQINEPEQEAEE